MAGEAVGELVVDGMPHSLELDRDMRKFQVRIGEHLGVLEFELAGSVLSLNHTEVAPALNGKGVGAALARAALDYARGHRLTVRTYCPFVAKYLKRHPEYQDLVDPEFP